MKKIALLTAAVAAGLLVGCNENNKKEEAANASKYSILKGSTAEDKAWDTGKEPAVNPDTRFAAGQLAEAQNNLQAARMQYAQALLIEPKHVPSLYRMGIVLTKQKEYDKAVVMWKRYIDATGRVASGYSNLGFTYEMAGDVDKAEQAYKEGLALDPNCQPCRVNYGLMLARNNRNTEAEVQLSAVLTPAEVSYNLAAVYEQQGAVAQAKEELKKALQANPNMTEAQSRLAALPQD